jgi:hypothetical protein
MENGDGRGENFRTFDMTNFRYDEMTNFPAPLPASPQIGATLYTQLNRQQINNKACKE